MKKKGTSKGYSKRCSTRLGYSRPLMGRAKSYVCTRHNGSERQLLAFWFERGRTPLMESTSSQTYRDAHRPTINGTREVSPQVDGPSVKQNRRNEEQEPCPVEQQWQKVRTGNMTLHSCDRLEVRDIIEGASSLIQKKQYSVLTDLWTAHICADKPLAHLERRGRHVRPGGLGGPGKRCSCLVSGLNQFQKYELIQCREWGGSGMTEVNSLWLEELSRLLQRIKQRNVAERAGNTSSTAPTSPHYQLKLMAHWFWQAKATF